jgi:hypothetical protein
MLQTNRTLQEYETSLAPADVLRAARQFFARNLNIYSAFLEKEGPTYAAFRGQGGEELIIGVDTKTGDAGPVTRVTGSSYLFDQQIARFFATLPPVPDSGGSGSGAT